MIINMIHENKNLLSLLLFSFLVVLRTYQCPWYMSYAYIVSVYSLRINGKGGVT